MVKYKRYFTAALSSVVLFLQIISPVLAVQTNNLRINATRQLDGDILAFKGKFNCTSLNARCLSKNERKIVHNICSQCKCMSKYTTYVSFQQKCVNVKEMTSTNCRIFPQKQLAMLGVATKAITRPIQAFRCEIKEKYPARSLYSKNGINHTWVKMMGIGFSLESSRRGRRRRSWLLKFKSNTTSKILDNYAGRIVKLKVRCRMRPKQNYYTNLCIIFKIAGSIVVNLNIMKYPTNKYSTHSQPTPFTPGNVYRTKPLPVTETPLPSGNNTVENQKSKSGRDNQTIWIVITVLTIVMVILIAVIVFICFKRRKARSDTVYRRRDIILHDYDVAIKSPFQEIHSHGANAQGGDHIYATIPERHNDNSPTRSSSPKLYQELNPLHRGNDATHYEPLVPPELQYVDVLPGQVTPQDVGKQ